MGWRRRKNAGDTKQAGNQPLDGYLVMRMSWVCRVEPVGNELKHNIIAQVCSVIKRMRKMCQGMVVFRTCPTLPRTGRCLTGCSHSHPGL